MKRLITLLLLFVVLDVSAAVSGGRVSSFGSRASISTSRVATNKPVVNTQKLNIIKPTIEVPKQQPKLYDNFKNKNTQIIPPTKRVIASDINKIFDKNYQRERKQSYYSNYHSPVYYQPVIQQHSNYGIWEAAMLWSILDNVGDRNMYYNHRDEPSFREWRADADKLCRDGIKEVCDKIKSLDSDVATQQSRGVKVNPTYITDGVDPNIYTTQNVVNISELPEIKICTGTASSDYSRFSNRIADITKLKIRNVYTNGSVDNLFKLASGECDLAFTQPDAKVSDELTTIVELKKKEVALLICNSDIKDSSKLTDNNTIYVGSDQTGSKYTLGKFIENFDGFKSAIINSDKTTIEASTVISKEKDSCLFTVDTWDAPFISNLEKENKSKLIPITSTLGGYTQVVIDKGHYKNLTLDDNNGFFDIGTDSLGMSPILVTTKSFVDKFPTIFYDVLMLNKDALAENLQ